MHTGLLLEMAAEGLGGRIAVGPLESGITFANMLVRAREAAVSLAASPARTLAYIGLNSPAFSIALFASAFANRPFAPLNYRLPDAELRRLLARTAPCLVIVDDDMLVRAAGVDGVTVVARSRWLAAPAALAVGPEPVAADPEDIAVLLFTSGTTAEPKAAVLRHRHLTGYVISTLEFMAAAEDEAALVSVPPYHIAAVSAVLTSAYLGRRVVHLENFAPEDWVRLARRERVTHAMLVPTMLGRVLDVLETSGEQLPFLRHLSYGGGPMPTAAIERAMRFLPAVDFVNGYGLTETSSTIAVLTPEDHRAAQASEDPAIRRRLGSVGRPLPAIELEIRDAEGRSVPAGEPGEVWVRGEQVSGEYLNQNAIRADGWFSTRDYGWLDEGGFLFLGGRLDDVIVRGGENLSPGEIEEVLRAHPDVRDVAVIGLPDDEWGERVAAVVVSRGDRRPEELRRWVRERLRSTKTPEDIIYRDTLPYNETGKLLRRALKLEVAQTAPPARAG
ncbi:MAG: long-chain fatty acid--CoA ligase [Burkholderiales bacterium]|nr:long-chain fatty acid--CoA ligase [Burkholderiales bacterium]